MQHGNDEVDTTDEMCSWCGSKTAMIFTTKGSFCSNRCKDRSNYHRNPE